MTVKKYARRSSATTALKKLGIQVQDYNLFIEQKKDYVLCDLDSAVKHLRPGNKVGNKLTSVPPMEVGKPSRKRANSASIFQVAKNLIVSGKTNAEVWAALKAQFGCTDTKKHYPAWYRAKLKRDGVYPVWP